MAVVDGLSKARMLAIEAASITGASISSGHLLLTSYGGTVIDVGTVVGPAASISGGPPTSPINGQMFFDSSNFSGLTDLAASKNPSTSTANWVAYGFGYDTGCTFSLAGGGVTLTGTGTGPGNHFAGVNITGLSPGESYFAQIKVRVPTGSPDVAFTVGYKTSGHLMRIKDQDVTLALAFTADATSAAFGVEFMGSGTVVVKSMSVWVLNQRGYPAYIYDGAGWVETVHMAQKGDIYSRVNTFGNQVINGVKQFAEAIWIGAQSNAFFIAGSNIEPGALPIAQISQDNSSGGFAGLAIRGGPVAVSAVGRSVGIVFKMSSEATTTESNKGWEIVSYSSAAWANSPSLIIRSGNSTANAVVINPDTLQVDLGGFALNLGRSGTTADSAELSLWGADAGAGGGGGGINFFKNAVAKWRLYTLGSGDGNFYFRDQANAKMVMRLQPGGAGASAVEVYDKLTTDQLVVTRTIDISGGDANNYYMGGFYNGSSITNAPDTGWWYIAVQQHSNVGSQYSMQTATELVSATPRQFVRMRIAGTWGAWQSVYSVNTPWTAVTFANSWVNYGAPYQVAQYRRVGDEVQCRGLIKSGVVASPAFTLPAGFTPPAGMLFPSIIAGPIAWASGAASAGTAHTHTQSAPTNVAARINVDASGAVTPSQGTNGYFDLSAIRFSTTA